MQPIITAFESSPDQGRGLARDMRVRWALEEAGRSYDVRLLSFAQMKQPAHRGLSPFGQIPTFEEGSLRLFESGAIVFHIAQTCAELLPERPEDRARATMRMFAALNTVEPPIVEREQVPFEKGAALWSAQRIPGLEDRIHARLEELARWLGEANWLEGRFSVGDLMMVMVLRRLEGMAILEQHPTLVSYVARAASRPAYQRAFAAQLEVFRNQDTAA